MSTCGARPAEPGRINVSLRASQSVAPFHSRYADCGISFSKRSRDLMSPRDDRIAELRARLASLDRERSAAEAELASLDSMPELPAPPLPRTPRSEGSEVDHQSPIINKISLFRRLFLG